MLRDMLRFLWRQDDESAAILCIVLAWYMTAKSREQIADYMCAMNEAAKAAGGGDG